MCSSDLLDEPLTALDAALRERLRTELDQLLRALGITTVYVTHDQSEAMGLGDRIVVMQQGSIAQIGTPREVYFEPASRFVAEFIGAANVLEGAMSDGALVLPGGRLPMPKVAIGGGRVSVMLRPEAVQLCATEGASWQGQVQSISFLGDRQRATITGAADQPLMVEVPNISTLKAGDRVGLHVDSASLRLLPD